VIQGKELREYATRSGRLTKEEANYAADKTVDVGSYPALPNGLRDMCGNVWEWMGNWYGPYSKDAKTDPVGPKSGKYKSVRGGSWYLNNPQYLRAANRHGGHPDNRYYGIGFRWVAPQDFVKPL
jgi:formylglycine-generating enzyme required for sulfatase activity